MATKHVKIFFAISIIFYILLGFYLWYSVYTIRDSEFEKAAKTASFINSDIDSSYSVDFSFSSPYFLDKSNELFMKYPILAGIIIESETDGLQYLKLNDSRLLASQNLDFSSSGQTPELLFSHPFMKNIVTSLYFSNGQRVTSSLVFDLLDRSLFFPVLRNTLIIALAYLVIAVIVLSIYNPTADSKDIFTLPSAYKKNGPDLSVSEDTDDEFIESDIEAPDQSKLPVSAELSSGMYSDRSGLVWEHFLSEKLDAELKRAASFDQDSCLVFISIMSPSGFIPYRNIAEIVVEHFTYKDLAFESGDNKFCIIVPEKDIDEGQIEVERFKKSIISRFADSGYKIYAGLTSRNSRLLSEKRMIHEAKAALAKAEEEADSTTIAFRTDLNKYREYIASNI